MTVSEEKREFNILGSPIKISESESDGVAMRAIECVQNEVNKIKSGGKNIADRDIAVLVALEFAGKYLNKDQEFKSNIFALREDLMQAKTYLNHLS